MSQQGVPLGSFDSTVEELNELIGDQIGIHERDATDKQIVLKEIHGGSYREACRQVVKRNPSVRRELSLHWLTCCEANGGTSRIRRAGGACLVFRVPTPPHASQPAPRSLMRAANAEFVRLPLTVEKLYRGANPLNTKQRQVDQLNEMSPDMNVPGQLMWILLVPDWPEESPPSYRTAAHWWNVMFGSFKFVLQTEPSAEQEVMPDQQGGGFQTAPDIHLDKVERYLAATSFDGMATFRGVLDRCLGPGCLKVGVRPGSNRSMYGRVVDGYSEVEEEAKLRKCSRCRWACYCSAECQKQHWKEHKSECIAPSRSSDAAATVARDCGDGGTSTSGTAHLEASPTPSASAGAAASGSGPSVPPATAASAEVPHFVFGAGHGSCSPGATSAGGMFQSPPGNPGEFSSGGSSGDFSAGAPSASSGPSQSRRPPVRAKRPVKR